MPRFVILEHDHPKLHWDLLLEQRPILRAWRLLECPAPGKSIPAEANVDHRLLYLDYEGEVSGNRGRVVAWDRGEYEIQEESEKRIALFLQGKRLTGLAVLEKGDDNAWLFRGPAGA